ncbi:MAG TPA: transcriptional repressor LexA [Syntrophaceae bacterium]|nr:transcriptional repressor LexA [Syntrophaceae bacterium]
MEPLSTRQEEILKFLAHYQAEHGFPPTAREIAGHFGFKSHKAAVDHVKALERKGYLQLHKGKSRGMEITSNYPSFSGIIPVVGRIGAGTPIFAIENLEETLKIDSSLFSRGECFAVRVKGDSMIEAHIKDGDYVILKRQDYAENGDIAGIVMGDEVTLKYYYKRKGRIELVPANPKLKPIIIEPGSESLQIAGIMVGLIRRR